MVALGLSPPALLPMRCGVASRFAADPNPFALACAF